MKSCVIYDEIFLEHNLESHPENAKRLIHFLKHLPEFNISILTSKPVSSKILEKAHSKEYINFVREKCKEGLSFLDPDTYVNERSIQVASFAAGALEKAVELCTNGKFKRIFCAVRPPGHHAERNRAMGFCIFNNIAIGAYKALESGMNKIFIIDFDAHHGNGTQHMFYNDSNVFYFSTHQYPFYPGTGSEDENNEHILNIPLRSGSGDSEFKEIYGSILPKYIKEFNPDILLVSAGFDIHEEDPLTNLNVTDEGVKFIVSTIVDISKNLGKPVIFTLEGGYNLSTLERCGKIVFSIL